MLTRTYRCDLRMSTPTVCNWISAVVRISKDQASMFVDFDKNEIVWPRFYFSFTRETHVQIIKRSLSSTNFVIRYAIHQSRKIPREWKLNRVPMINLTPNSLAVKPSSENIHSDYFLMINTRVYTAILDIVRRVITAAVYSHAFAPCRSHVARAYNYQVSRLDERMTKK